MAKIYNIYIFSLARSVNFLSSHIVLSLNSAVLMTAGSMVIYLILIEQHIIKVEDILNYKGYHFGLSALYYLLNVIYYIPQKRYVKIEKIYRDRVSIPSIVISWVFVLTPFFILGIR